LSGLSAAFLGHLSKEVRPTASCAENRLVGRTSSGEFSPQLTAFFTSAPFTDRYPGTYRLRARSNLWVAS
jgi:hypothetical protein